MADRETVFFVGPLPPPVHGFSEINGRMLRELSARHNVSIFNLTPRLGIFGLLALMWGFLVSTLYSKPAAVYLAFSGGKRQWLDIYFFIVSRLRGVPIFLHHHSFSYLNNRMRSAGMAFKLAATAKHIVLCECMKNALVREYEIQPLNCRVLSNTAFLDDIEKPQAAKVRSGPIRVGFLSNITAEKGIFEFLSILSECAKAEFDVEGLIAGPVEQGIRDEFLASLAATGNARHVGPVYGAAKAEFFSSIDVLLFPTRYANEAEPVTILESLGRGVPVIAFSRGCIEGMISSQAGAVMQFSDDYIQRVIAEIRPFAMEPERLAQARHGARQAFEIGREASKGILEALVAEIGGGVGGSAGTGEEGCGEAKDSPITE
ncbi:glycosyltransferase family 4 protein [Cupriavidus sp. BIC8F]|uniref:glycosyltransferase family 4 protein n=1 Tax=Cupriavidus sp. BIC8F TaxID=3079014 RepID=UPI002916D4A9|nr:glycosyltransferase family 4 protein [Cupriavidus sp. BIC8F]